ncbi:tripartite tricarboxylate transporter substrate binding protein [uncultured Propionivibrio sp.]|uniref:Bug family tripartite tricarboxylate transporter substrate binding protein n=1 Tax=uncultured Propionivibrio sp. TaxID=426737 RepID=UPI0029C07FDC|nr:tripartite tricarboxylate transporter substrate binding protein [uncultured Propionivibrio sp.]
MNKTLFSLAVSACLSLVASPSMAKDEWPTDTVKIIVPFTAGGTTDIFARVIGDHLQKAFGKPFIIENVPGAGSVNGIAQVARSKPDGLTIGIASTSGLAINPQLRPDQVPYKPLKDLIPVTMFDKVPNVLVINSGKLPVKSVPELIDYLKKNPGKVAYGSSGVGTSQHLAAELFQQMTGTKITHVPYPGSARMVTDMLGGQVAMTFDNVPLLLPHVQAGKLTMLATATAKRAAFDEKVPAVAEFLPGFEAVAWHGFIAPAGTPKEIVDKLAAEVQACMKKPETIKKFSEAGAEAVATSPKEFADYIAAEMAKWKAVIEKANLQVK